MLQINLHLGAPRKYECFFHKGFGILRFRRSPGLDMLSPFRLQELNQLALMVVVGCLIS
jgi:hypothetical protein